MHAVRGGAVAVLVSVGLMMAQGVVVAEPSGSGSTSEGASGGNSPSANGSDDTGSAGAPEDTGSGGSPSSTPGSDPDDVSPDAKSELVNDLAKIDAEVAEVATLRGQVHDDPGFVPEAVAMVDTEADELIREQQLVHSIADEQGIGAPPPSTATAAPPPPVPPKYANTSIDQIMMQISLDRQSMLDAQQRTQAAQIKAQNDRLVELNTKLQDPNLSQLEKDVVKTQIASLTSTSQLEMTQLNSVMNKFNQTTAELSNWLSKDAQSKNTITGNLR